MLSTEVNLQPKDSLQMYMHMYIYTSAQMQMMSTFQLQRQEHGLAKFFYTIASTTW